MASSSELLPVCDSSSAMVPAKRRRPSHRKATSSASVSSSVMMCDVMSTDRPSRRTARIFSLSTFDESGSRPAVGSSRMSSDGRNQKAMAAFTFCRVPPDSVPTNLSLMASISNARSRSSSVASPGRSCCTSSSTSPTRRFTGKCAACGM